jgi:hypothetical protein
MFIDLSTILDPNESALQGKPINGKFARLFYPGSVE